MSCLKINGGRRLSGEVAVHGAKNSILPILAASFLSDGECIIHNCPIISDVDICLKILRLLGCRVKAENHDVSVKSAGCYGNIIPEELMREMRSSIVFMGAVASKCGSVSLSLPGGCELGPRPVDLHIEAMKRLGAKTVLNSGRLECSFPDGVKPCEIHLKLPSVGATENIILSTVISKGTTTVKNAAKEPEICDLCSFLNAAGGNISGHGTDTIIINGVKKLGDVEYTVMPDRIEASTFLFALSSARGKISVKNCFPEHISLVTSLLSDSGCDIKISGSEIIACCDKRLSAFDTVSTGCYPGFATDLGPLCVAAATVYGGTSVFTENIFYSRYRYVDELQRLGAKIKTVGRVAVITGTKALYGADVNATDLRGGAALIIAALTAEGTSHIGNLCYIDRGYESIENSFSMLGADIIRTDSV